MKCEAGPTENLGNGQLKFAGKAMDQIVLCAINTVRVFMESVVIYLVDCRMWPVSDIRFVDGQLFREVVAIKEIMITSFDKLECVDKFC